MDKEEGNRREEATTGVCQDAHIKHSITKTSCKNSLSHHNHIRVFTEVVL